MTEFSLQYGSSRATIGGRVSTREEARLIFCLLVTFGVFWRIQLLVTFFLLSRDFFRALSPGRIPKPLLAYNFFRPQTANAVKYSTCSPLEASRLAFDGAPGSSATHPSQSCSPQQPMEEFALDKQGST